VTDDDFYYEPNYKVLICKKHKQAVKGLDTHLREVHRLTKKERRLLVDRFAMLTLAKPNDVITPLKNRPLFKALRDPVLAYQCNSCSQISTNWKTIQRHCNKKHQWCYSKETLAHWIEVQVQSFFEGFHQCYFIVQDKLAVTEPQNDLPEEDDDNTAQLKQEFKETREKDVKKQAVVEKEIEKSNNTSW
jgi:hypothetical protein